MARSTTSYPADPLEAMSMFHRGKDPANQSMRRLLQQLKKAKIVHAILGGMAVYAHGHRRMTDDVDVLLTPEGFATFRDTIVPENYDLVPRRPRRFVDRSNGVILDVLVTGLFPGRGQPGPIAFPDPTAVRQLINKVYYVDLPTLIQLKLAARRHQDFADVVSLIAAHDLDESYLERLDASLRSDFIECLEEKRREDEYEARNG